MNNSKQFAIPILITILLVILIISFRSFLLTNIVEPVALLFWAVWRIIASVDQNVYWIVLIVFCSILVFRLFPSGRENSHELAYNYRDKSLDRVEHWRTLIKDAALGNSERRRLRDSLKVLLTTVVAQDEHSEPTGLEEGIANGKIPLPLTTQRFLYPQNGMHRSFSMNQQLNILSLAPRWLRRWAGKFIHQDHILIDETLRWMEIELEINDEN